MTENQYKGRKRTILSMSSYRQVDSFADCINKKCKKCKGACCESFPCTLSPFEFVDIEDINYMKSVLDTGVLTIAPGNIAKTFYLIRPRGEKDTDFIIADYVPNPNDCLLHGKKGCLLDPIARPTEGLLLLPRDKGRNLCECLYSEMKLMEDWFKYQDVLNELRKKYKGVQIPKDNINEETIKIYRLKLFGVDRKETN